MQFKIPPRRILFLVAVLGFFSYLFISNNVLPSLKTKDLIITAPDTSVSYFLPVRLKIPRLSIDATIEYVGLTPDGAMDVPKGPANVAWFDLGPRPGEPGSAVLAGHSGFKNGKPAVFDNLYKLQKGDKIYVENEKGLTATFVVRESRNYNPNAGATDVFISNDGKAHLNLITCTGFWNKILESHSERLVVFTDKE